MLKPGDTWDHYSIIESDGGTGDGWYVIDDEEGIPFEFDTREDALKELDNAKAFASHEVFILKQTFTVEAI